ncbi:hypothetical protein HDG32_004028 [Paraburkholderia sp. CI2]|uniref:hypothetical protein n=1 Tax=Paraburkholderia sp. CI2 TaxID=2723093 RepID=UPI00161250F9|nr:hypothetical protein [Paraburkholderia sp. CI2]MBB5467904.1 hypothetical protein [Paraburkholderia sp. CI2]
MSKKNTFHSYRGATAKYILQALLQPAAGCGMLVAIVMIALSAFVLYQSRRDAAEYTRINLRNIALIAERWNRRPGHQSRLLSRLAVSLIGKDGVTIMRQPLGNGILGKDIGQSHTFRRFISAPEGSFRPLLKPEWVIWRVKGGREPGAANP